MSDFLSRCPALLQILSFVKYKDILNCYRMNHRIHGVIRRNRTSLPKPEANVIIEHNHKRKELSVRVSRKVSSPPFGFKKNKRIIDAVVTPEKISFVKETALVRKSYQNGVAIRHSVNLVLSPIQQTLESLLLVIFEHYFIDNMAIVDWKGGALDMISQVVLSIPRKMIKCNCLTVPMWPGLCALTDHLGTREVVVIPAESSPLTTLTDLPYSHRTSVTVVLIEAVELVDALIDLVKKWQEGVERIRMFVLLGTLPFFNWSPTQMERALKGSLTHFETKFCSERLREEGLIMHFRRPADERILVLHFQPKQIYSMRLYESQLP